MDDAAAARREARRRRILENSHNRLQLITGKTCDASQQVESEVFTENSRDCSAPVCPNNGSIIPENNMFELISSNPSEIFSDSDLPNELLNFSPSNTDMKKSPTLWDKLIAYKFDIMLVSIIIQILHSLSVTPSNETYILLPVLMYVIIKLTFFNSQPQSKMGSILMLMGGMSSTRIQNFLVLVQILLTFAEDVCIFLFTTICIQTLLLTIIVK